MRANRGFTLIELMIVIAIAAIVSALVVRQGLSARQAAGLAGGAYDLALRIGGIKARAMAEGVEYVLVISDTADAASCRDKDTACGRIVVLKKPVTAFTIDGFDPDPPIAGAEYADDPGARYLPRNSQFDLASTWRAPAPFATVAAFDSNVLGTCTSGRRCFGLRFEPDGEVRPYLTSTSAAVPAGFAFVLRPLDVSTRAAERRAIFVSFPAGIVKTAAF